MQNDDFINFGLEFIQTCCAAQNQFDAWVEHFSEAELKAHFERLVEMRTHLNDVTREGKAIIHKT